MTDQDTIRTAANEAAKNTKNHRQSQKEEPIMNQAKQEEKDTAKSQAKAQVAYIVELIDALNKTQAGETAMLDGYEVDEDGAREVMDSNALEITVRGDWYTPGTAPDSPTEFCILLCTGGPAVRIIGDLTDGSPSRARVQYQDWGTPWTELFSLSQEEKEAITAYCEQCYFGE